MSMFQLPAVSYKQAVIKATHRSSCRNTFAWINMNKTELLSDLCLQETLTKSKTEHTVAAQNDNLSHNRCVVNDADWLMILDLGHRSFRCPLGLNGDFQWSISVSEMWGKWLIIVDIDFIWWILSKYIAFNPQYTKKWGLMLVRFYCQSPLKLWLTFGLVNLYTWVICAFKKEMESLFAEGCVGHI